MNLSVGIVGLPNVGKSTLFNAILKKQAAYAANYPFATIEPNIGVVEVPDERLEKIAAIVKTEKIVRATIEFYDIAGLVKGASEGQGLGNKFLSHIREVNAIVHVVRLFEDDDVIHVANKVDPLDDMKTIETELILADLSTIEKQKEPRGNPSKDETARWEVVKKMKTALDAGQMAKTVVLTDEELPHAKQLNLLTMKPMLFVFNVSEQQLENPEQLKAKIRELGFENNYLYLCARLENEVLTFPPEEQKEYLSQFNLTETGLNRLIKETYTLLGLISFLTGGELEARAWTIKAGSTAPQAAAAIHTDFEKHFIKADIVPFPAFVEAGGWVKAREQGKVQIVGKDYIMKDGDVVEFKVGV